MSESKLPSPGFDTRVETRLPPSGVLQLDLTPGQAHEIVVHIPGGEAPGATVPQQGVAPGGMALPKLGQKWSTSAPTGQGRVGVVVTLPPARGVTPQIGLSYTTAGGNGPFGWGWRGPVPQFERASTKAILREHGRGVPEYDDAGESDVFVFSDADELVKTGEGIDASTGAMVVRYHARTEGGFARIERHEKAGRSHFVVHDGGGVVSLFGQADEATVADPADPKRIFRWLLQQQRDPLGNVAVYRYVAEDDVGVDTGHGAERSRCGPQPQRYLRRVLYGNRDVPPGSLGDAIDPASLDDEAARSRFLFEVVLDYGQHASGEAAGVDDAAPWPVRADPFSGGRAGFEIRTRRLCRRVLVFHRFAQLAADQSAVLTRVVTFGYDEDPAGSRLVSVTLTGVGDDTAITLPPRTFTYSPRVLAPGVRTIDTSATGGLDLSLPAVDAELFDLHADGEAGLLTREHGRFVFRRRTAEGFAAGEPIPFGATPSTDPAAHVQRWLDTGGGLPSLVEFGPSDATVFHRDATGRWCSAQVPAGNTPPVGKDATALAHRIYLADLDGDGIADVLVASEGKYVWWRRMGDRPGDGWQVQPPVEHDGDEARGPGPVLFDAARDLAPEGTRRTEAIVLADMTGDGLPDVVRVRADEIAYWPNLGRGRFGGKVVLGPGPGAPMDETRVRACDVDGLGPASLLLLGEAGGATLWTSECGNRLVPGPTVSLPPLAELALSSLGRVDGSPTGSLVWASKTASPTITIVDFVARAPWLLVGDDSGTGLRTTIRYGTAAAHARSSAADGRPWRTRLPVALSVVDAVVVEDLVRGTRFSSSYRYAHGHWDPAEREFRGFGFVEQRDVDDHTAAGDGAFQTSAADLGSAPARTRSWYFVGADVDLQHEYDRSDPQAVILPPPDLTSDLGAFSGADRDEAARALRGVLLRTERYTDDAGFVRQGAAPALPQIAARPWVTTSHGWIVRSVHAKGGGHHASMQPLQEQTLTYTDERGDVADPRLLQTASLVFDELGFVTCTATVAYPRRRAVAEPTIVPPKPPDPDPGSPSSVLLRVVGFAFDTDKSFVLPQALPGIAVLKAQCAAQAAAGTGGEVLVVGHTDRTGDADDNLGISLQRARRVVELLRGDVEAWLALFDASLPASIRWGAHEQAHMLAALGHGGDAPGDVLGFQTRAFGSPGSGLVDEPTLRALVQHYMARSGAAVDPGLRLHAVGAGEGFVAEATDDGASSPANRRIEAFVFADAITPPPPEKFLAADATEYATWVARASARADVDAASGAVTVDGAAVAAPLVPEPRPAAATSTASADDPQRRTVILVDEVDLVHQQQPDVHRLGTVVERRSYDVTGKPGDPTAPMPVAALRAAATGGEVIAFDERPSGAHQRRLVARTRQTFYDDALTKEAQLGEVGKRALPAKSKAMAMSVAQADAAVGPMAIAARSEDAAAVLKAGGYLNEDGGWWVPSSRVVFSAEAFYRPIATIDPFGTVTQELTYDRDAYLIVRQVSAREGGPALMSSTSYEYRSFGARGSFDANGSATIRRFDALGRVVSEVRRGDPSGGQVDSPPDGSGLRGAEYGSEGDDDDAPTILVAYDDHAFVRRGAPCSMTRTAKLEYGGRDVRVAIGVTYFDGAGGVAQSKTAMGGGRWRSSGRTIVNDRGLPVLEFSPFVSGSSGFDPIGGSGGGQLIAQLRYDGLDRRVHTEYPDGTHERVVPGAWETTTYDRNDTVLQSTWLGDMEKASGARARAAAGAVAHADTPTTVRTDVLGRPVAVFERLRDDTGAGAVIVTRTHLDVSGNVVEIVDARGNVAERREHGMLGQVLVVTSVDAGQTRSIADVLGAPLRSVDARGNVFFTVRDAQRRPLEDWVATVGEGVVLLAKRVFGDGVNDCKAGGCRQRGRLVRVYDGGGETKIEGYDLDGNPTAVTRRLVDLPGVLETARIEGRAARARVDWSALGSVRSLGELDVLVPALDLLEDKVYRTVARYDAHGRAVETTLPLSGSTHRMRYTEDGALQRIDRETAAGTSERVYEAGEFDHFGRPLRVEQGEGAVRTSYAYDRVTERLLRLQSRTGGGRALQDLQYAYDPMGNITSVHDGAQAPVYRDNAELAASNDYRYDALYRLVEATGREHEGQAANGRGPADVVPLRASSPSDPKAMRRYVQRYRYDAVGNLTTLQHFAGAGSWRREYAYGEHGNRLRATGNAAAALHERYEHDVAGNIVAMPHLSRMHWDELGQLEYVRRGNDHVWLQYAGGARVRKLVLRGQGVVEDRRYLGAEELYTKRRGKAGGGAVVEQTLTEHAGGGLQVDVRLVVDGKTIAKPVALRRFAVADHLGSCRVEVDPDGGVIAYEEFHPYGTTSYRAMRSGLDAAAGRYRFTGMERDEETGLAQHGARCYAGWLGRWVSADPIGVGDGVNRFAYCRGSPVGCVDTDGCRTSAPDEDAMAAPRSRTRSRMYDLVRPPPEPEEWELEFYDPDPMGTGFMNGMRGTHASEMSPAGRLADIAVGAASDSWDVFGTLAAVSGRMLVGPKGRNVHIGLDVVGLVPGPVGVAADLLNALLYEIQDDPANAALSAVSAIGGIVDAVKAAKYAGDLVEGAVLMLTGGGTKVTTRAARQREVLEEFESHQRGVHGSAGEGPLAAAITSKRSKYSDYAEHHLYPQEAKHRKWFADRGVDVDDYVVRLPKAEHEALHGGGNWRLARRVWEGEWNREIMQRMHREEARLGHRMVAEEMLPVLKKMMSDYLVDGRPITRYRRARKKR